MTGAHVQLQVVAGFAYAPQFADLPDQKMWRIDRTADYGAFQEAARGRVDLARIERQGEDILRLADEPGYRRLIKAQVNLQEGRHALARKIFHGRSW
ncbi:TnpA family transposase [Streptomyces sp. V3I8]|nr:Tn3 family transposase [Streptomyces sp. V3I8]MDQ1038141.1 TnpA family transposase [Streptomyces sp. V3I8]